MEIRSTGLGQMNSLSTLDKLQGKSAGQSDFQGVQKPGFTRSSDEFVLSSEALELQSTSQTTSMHPIQETAAERAMRIEEIKSQIANGHYDTEEKLNAAVEKMLNRLFDKDA